MLFSNPRVLPALLLCVGFGLAGYRYMQLQKMPVWTDADLDLAAELNYALDLSRAEQAGEPLPDAQERIEGKAAVRAEIEAHFVGARKELETQIEQGLLAGMVGILLYLAVLVMQRKGIIK